MGTFLFFILVLFTRQLEAASQKQAKLPETFDFIVVGAGSAGAVVASRLSENNSVTVLLLEAGINPDTDDSLYEDVPYKLGKIPKHLLWNFVSEPQKHCCKGFIGQRQPWPRGKVLGGSSTINNQGHTRGSRLDFDKWAKLGNWGWRFADVLPYFLLSEDNQVPYYRDDFSYHNTGGLLPVSIPRYKTPLADAWLQAGRELGYPLADYNSYHQSGFSFPTTTMKNGETYNTYKAFLKPFLNRNNLFILTEAFVTKILINANTNTATGVTYEHNGKQFTASAKLEVIVSGGTVQSPQLLMVSGVGPRETLEKHKIPVIVDSPGVGQNLINHMSFTGLIFNLDFPVTFNDSLVDTEENWELWHNHRIGPLTSIERHEGKAFIASRLVKPEERDLPDILIKYFSSKTYNWGLPQDVYEKYFGPIPGQAQISFLAVGLDPKSVGYLTIRSADMHDPPIIQPNSFTHEEDIEVLLEAVRIVFAIANTTAFRTYGSRYHGRKYPLCSQYPNQYSDDYWRCVILNYSFGAHQPVGTCKMGIDSDPKSVLDPTLKVRGVNRLRVIDASVMPTTVAAHTNIPTVMIGEKGAHMIKQAYGLH